ncbi:hypothetical protein SKAU_G00143330 [Synaphobranchus kaupii]|uniref:Uncharacterized protein n=1 Tax=Synaphobranchus kaupii TaxID=118154 RepID=A0A9Q1FTQ5_SYNKA|nr:hypothetical protein SKAU_G00143330 [Synaphobranchus kaupii]
MAGAHPYQTSPDDEPHCSLKRSSFVAREQGERPPDTRGNDRICALLHGARLRERRARIRRDILMQPRPVVIDPPSGRNGPRGRFGERRQFPRTAPSRLGEGRRRGEGTLPPYQAPLFIHAPRHVSNAGHPAPANCFCALSLALLSSLGI